MAKQTIPVANTTTIWREIVSPVNTPAAQKAIDALRAGHRELYSRMKSCGGDQPKELLRGARHAYITDPSPANFAKIQKIKGSLDEIGAQMRQERSMHKSAIRHFSEHSIAPVIEPMAQQLKSNIEKAKQGIHQRPELQALSQAYGVPVEEIAQPLAGKLGWASGYLDGVLAACKTGMATPDALDEIFRLAQ